MVQALTNPITERGYQVLMGQIRYSPDQEADMLRTVIGRRPDGIVLTDVTHIPEARKLLTASDIPIVETWDITPDPIDMMVSFSQEKTSAEVCRFFAGKGRERIRLIRDKDSRSLWRNEAFIRTALEIRLSAPRYCTVLVPTTHANRHAAFSSILSEHLQINAVYSSSDMLATGIPTEARIRRLATPQQLAVIGSGDLDCAATLEPSLTTVRTDTRLLVSHRN